MVSMPPPTLASLGTRTTPDTLAWRKPATAVGRLNELIRQVDLAAAHHAQLVQLQKSRGESHATLLAAVGAGTNPKLSDEADIVRLVREHNQQTTIVERAWRSIDKHHVRAAKSLRLLSYGTYRYSSGLNRLTSALRCRPPDCG